MLRCLRCHHLEKKEDSWVKLVTSEQVLGRGSQTKGLAEELCLTCLVELK